MLSAVDTRAPNRLHTDSKSGPKHFVILLHTQIDTITSVIKLFYLEAAISLVTIRHTPSVELSLTGTLRAIPEWELLPSPPPSPDMSPTRRDGHVEPTTPTRGRVAPYTTGNPAVDSPRVAMIKEGIRESREKEECATASSTPAVTPKKRIATDPAARPNLFSETSTRSSNSHRGEQTFVRAAIEGDVSGQMTREELLGLLDIKNKRLGALEETVRGLQKQVEALIAERDFFGPSTPVSPNLPSPNKGKGKASRASECSSV